MKNRRLSRPEDGFTLLEVVMTASIAAIMALASATVFSSNLVAVDGAKQMVSGAQFLETVMEDLSAQPFDALLALHGNTIFDAETLADSAFTVDLSVFESGVGRIQVQALLTDRATQRRMGEVTALRAEW